MIKRLKVNKFRIFEDKEILFGKYITVLSGRNSTGKSTILGMIANSCELKKNKGVPLIKASFKSDFSEIFHGSESHDLSGSDRFTIFFTEDFVTENDYRKCRVTWQTMEGGKKRFRVIPEFKVGRRKRSSKLPYPIIYLGLSRLFPIGESNSVKKAAIKKFTDEYQQWFIEKYKEILSLHEDITEISNVSLDDLSMKYGVGVSSNNYDYLTNSSGQDNLGQILLALLSFRLLKENNPDDYKGGILLIDEIDATIHSAAQKRLIDLLIQYAREYDLQTVFTTHSSSLLKHISDKIEYNNDDSTNNGVELYYLTKANRHLDIKRNISYNEMENDLLVQPNIINDKLKVYSEDEENRWFLKQVLKSDYLTRIHLLDVSLGCEEILTLCKADISYFANVMIVFDGDVNTRRINQTPLKTTKNYIKLPSSSRPEEVIYNYLLGLDSNHLYWQAAQSAGITWDVINDRGPMSASYRKFDKDRDKYKNWFNDYKSFFESTNLFEYWKSDNEAIVTKLNRDFKKAYNTIADRTFISKIL